MLCSASTIEVYVDEVREAYEIREAFAAKTEHPRLAWFIAKLAGFGKKVNSLR